MADKTSNSEIREVTATLGDLRISPRKVKLVTDLVKKKRVADARVQLQFLTKKAAHPILKLINSAVANATHNFHLNSERLFVKSITVNQGTMMKRFKPHAQGRAFPIRRRISVVCVTLVEHGPSKTPKKAKPEQKKKSGEAEPAFEKK